MRQRRRLNLQAVECQPNVRRELRLGRRVIDLERAFNRAAGFTPADDRLPDFFATEALSPTGAVFDVPADEMDHMWDKA